MTKRVAIGHEFEVRWIVLEADGPMQSNPPPIAPDALLRHADFIQRLHPGDFTGVRRTHLGGLARIPFSVRDVDCRIELALP